MIEIEGDRSYWTVSTGQWYVKNRLAKLAEDHPEVKLVAENVDGSVVYHGPKAFVKIAAPRRFTEEVRAAMTERLETARTKKKEAMDGG